MATDKYSVLSFGTPFIGDDGKVYVRTIGNVWDIAVVEENVRRWNGEEETEFVDYSLPETGVFA